LANQLLKEELPPPGQPLSPPARVSCAAEEGSGLGTAAGSPRSTQRAFIHYPLTYGIVIAGGNRTKQKPQTASSQRGPDSLGSSRPFISARPRGRDARARALSADGVAGGAWRGGPAPRQRRHDGDAGKGSACDTGSPARPGQETDLFCCVSSQSTRQRAARAPGQAERRQLPSEQEHS